ncbi:alpha/beta-hydrolase family protein, partial [Marinospirillum sp.]|uniref:alpha/beta hydrolase n=1 Tax=Marinospirillum sp. TaxID=2183934 RepID=UPI0028703913
MMIRKHFSTLGLLLGTLFFALSLTPSLLPRGEWVQGVISGLSMLAGYGCGVFLSWLWLYLGLAAPGHRLQRVLQSVAALFCGLLAISFLIQANDWQNSVRTLMGMSEVDQLRPWLVGGVAFAVFLVGLLLAKSFRLLLGGVSFLMQRLVPRRLSNLIGLVTAFVLFWAVIDGVLFTSLLRSVDSSYQQVDALIEPEMQPPEKPVQTGSEASLLAWESLGRQGRNFVAGGPDQKDIQVFSEQQARQPVRVYVGLNAAETPEERAELALEELLRTGGFKRSLLVLITPTGTGWIDPAAINTLEYLHQGNVASVAAQYSYLPSPVSLMAEGAYGVETSRALFEAVYGYWQALPESQRPELYLFGLSLGALNSDLSFDFYDIIDDPFDGVLWSGPPFSSPTWQSVTQRRKPDSPQWLPRFRDDSVVRFA